MSDEVVVEVSPVELVEICRCLVLGQCCRCSSSGPRRSSSADGARLARPREPKGPGTLCPGGFMCYGAPVV